jgi:hypothetical protein
MVSHEGAIEDFLGPLICNDDLVINSKLTAAESEDLESPLTIEEFDNAVREGNLKSAPGADGLGMPMIILCWDHLRIPLFKYVECCRRKGLLTDNFRGAQIRLIPKKNDLTNLKNWRPISLLSNLYKIISRVLNNRLSKYVNRICSRSQKGFNSSRYTQEAIINVWESIAYCRQNNVKAAIMAVDMEKAFDTISLSFLEKVYTFFGIGPNMRELLKLIGRDRFATILLEGGRVSSRFSLERGRPQGDIISPITFNFCVQILIFKLELDPEIKRIPRAIPVMPVINANPSSFFMYESRRETDKNEAMADDNTSITIFDPESIGRIKVILTNFGSISGLKCNVGKTVIMPTFDPEPAELDRIRNLGFEISDRFTLLGVEISKNLDNLNEIFTKLKNKITDLISFWERFRLTLPGRITIMKTCLVSQLCYLGSFLPVPAPILAEIQLMLNAFVKKNLRVSEERIYFTPEMGGLGCINLEDFLSAQSCSWIVRAHKYCIDNWRFDLKVAAPEGVIPALRSADINPISSPINSHLVSCFEKFYAAFTKVNNNFKNAFIFNNEAFTRDGNSTLLLDPHFFGQEFFVLNEKKIRLLRLSDFFEDGRMINMTGIARNGLACNPGLWMRLQSAGRLAWIRYHKTDPLQEKCTDVIEFFNGIKKGSKKLVKDFCTCTG